MKSVPQQVSESVRRRNPHLYGEPKNYDAKLLAVGDPWLKQVDLSKFPKSPKRIRQSTKPLLNKTEARFKNVMVSRGITSIMEQAITLRLDPPFKRYTPDLAYWDTDNFIQDILILVEVKGPHKFRRAGIAKAALAAKTYPQFRFELKEWTGKEWKESVLSP